MGGQAEGRGFSQLGAPAQERAAPHQDRVSLATCRAHGGGAGSCQERSGPEGQQTVDAWALPCPSLTQQHRLWEALGPYEPGSSSSPQRPALQSRGLLPAAPPPSAPSSGSSWSGES